MLYFGGWKNSSILMLKCKHEFDEFKTKSYSNGFQGVFQQLQVKCELFSKCNYMRPRARIFTSAYFSKA
jgi:hypothetical protein